MPTFGVQGLDVSGHQSGVDWLQQWKMGARFAYVKASEGNYYTNPLYGSQYQGARNVGMIRGAYHFAIPNWSSGADQARYFVDSGGGWTPDGHTLPPVLDFEFNPYEGRTIGGFYFGNTCYGMSPSQLTAWVKDFGNTMQALTGRLPVIYTNTSWWRQCLSDPEGFGDYPLWVAAYPGVPTNDAGPVPSSWETYSMWQYSSTGPFAGDSNVWNGTYEGLVAFAKNGVPPAAIRAIAELRAVTPALGSATSDISCGLPGGGCYQGFTFGAAVWHPATGAQPSFVGPIRDAWAKTGFEGGRLGYPTSSEICGLRDGGCYQAYQRGEILYTSTTGAQPSPFGEIRTRYRLAGAENGVLGYPTSAEICSVTNGGCYQSYQGGEIMWSGATGAQLTETGPIRTTYRQAGAETGVLGYPTSAKICGLRDGGCYQAYQRGEILWTTATGAHISRSGGIRDLYRRTGAENGALGYPTSAEICSVTSGGCYQSYQGGEIMWSGATGAQLTETGPIRTTYRQAGAETGVLGYPTSAKICGLRDGGCYQAYQRGEILWTTATGAHISRSGGIRDLYRRTGAENGALGYPTSAEICSVTSGGCYQSYQGGRIIWSAATGAQIG
ncbi:GH25 family lysozyme [Arthrobacter sp. S39]|uniref:GH25 family lysozyme n=1 Tax=Arthrobacter sp. S39 TaxID=2509720 RepID=UPI00103811F9|nr:GH25 family lysozyme [Arthrobacter sp. S39]TAP45614.1 lysozyme M1 [Arthrobacter sp. S39]